MSCFPLTAGSAHFLPVIPTSVSGKILKNVLVSRYLFQASHLLFNVKISFFHFTWMVLLGLPTNSQKHNFEIVANALKTLNFTLLFVVEAKSPVIFSYRL